MAGALVCRWCGAEVDEGEAVCLTCMRPARAASAPPVPDQVASNEVAAAPRPVPGPPSLDLELDLPQPARAPSPRVDPPPSPAPERSSGPDLPLLPTEPEPPRPLGPGESLTLESIAPPPPPPPRAVATGGLDLDDDEDVPAADIGLALDSVRPPAPQTSPQPKAPAPPPAATARKDEGDTASEEEVARLAGYGLAPEGIFASVGYALQVVRRRRELEAMLRQVSAFRDERRRGLGGKLAALVDGVRERTGPDADPAVMAIFRPIVLATQEISQQTVDLANQSRDYALATQRLDAELAARAADRERALAEQRTARVVVEDRMSTYNRRKADLDRVERDLRVANEAAAEAAGEAEFAPPEHARRIAQLQGSHARAAAELKEQERAVADARAQLVAADRRVRDLDRAMADVRARRHDLDRKALEARDRGMQGIQSAEDRRLDAYEAALRAIGRQHPELMQPHERESFAEIDGALTAGERQVELHRRARAAYDEDAFRRGLGVLAGGAALAVLAVILLAILVA